MTSNGVLSADSQRTSPNLSIVDKVTGNPNKVWAQGVYGAYMGDQSDGPYYDHIRAHPDEHKVHYDQVSAYVHGILTDNLAQGSSTLHLLGLTPYDLQSGCVQLDFAPPGSQLTIRQLLSKYRKIVVQDIIESTVRSSVALLGDAFINCETHPERIDGYIDDVTGTMAAIMGTHPSLDDGEGINDKPIWTIIADLKDKLWRYGADIKNNQFNCGQDDGDRLVDCSVELMTTTSTLVPLLEKLKVIMRRQSYPEATGNHSQMGQEHELYTFLRDYNDWFLLRQLKSFFAHNPNGKKYIITDEVTQYYRLGSLNDEDSARRYNLLDPDLIAFCTRMGFAVDSLGQHNWVDEKNDDPNDPNRHHHVVSAAKIIMPQEKMLTL